MGGSGRLCACYGRWGEAIGTWGEGIDPWGLAHGGALLGTGWHTCMYPPTNFLWALQELQAAKPHEPALWETLLDAGHPMVRAWCGGCDVVRLQ